MRVVFVAIGWENISLQAISAMLQKSGHETHLVYDQALFDDKNYLSIPWLARLLDQKDLVIQRIIELEPDLLGFSVQTIQFQEMRALAAAVKRHYKVPVIFGGIHPHSAPEQVLLPEDAAVDIICLGEGDQAIVELCDSMQAGRIDYGIKNLWFRLQDGTIIKNPQRPLISDLDQLPTIDKELFAPHYPMKYSYLSCPSRGCPFDCSYCSLSFLGQEATKMGCPRVRERSVDSLIAELKEHVARYQPAWVDFRQPVMSASEKWTVKFCRRYQEEIGLPFRCFSHPLLITPAAVKALHQAGCYAIQIGIECWDEQVRRVVINRRETNQQITAAARILEEEGQPYAFDYILGLPRLPRSLPGGGEAPLSEEETYQSFARELMGFAQFIAPLKHCYRIAPFMIQYMPGTDLIEHGLRAGDLCNREVQRLQQGLHDNYMASGSMAMNPQRLRLLNGYRVMLRLMSFLSPWAKRKLLQWKAYKIFWMAPFKLLISLLDLMIAVRDKDATTYAKNYWWWFRKRFDSNYHLHYFKKRKKLANLPGEIFALPKSGRLGQKTGQGWERNQ
ncbi:MAG: radical SAM protein [Desulfarculus sp.]|jgi:hypothetical protein|nr:MAG: radical SAM protein [Desulfarculus sp.]